MKRAFYISLLMAMAMGAMGQHNRGSWQEYSSYVSATRLADSGDQIFCAAGGGLFYVDAETSSINKITVNDGLSDVGIQILAWDDKRKTLLVAYKNSNLDLVTSDRIINLSDIKRKQLTGDKTVYNIHISEDEAFLACGFGIVAINLTRNEIKGTYVIGEDGSQVSVFDVATDGAVIFAATEKGILAADRDHPNLLDYRNWQRVGDIPHPEGKFKFLTLFNGRLIAVYTRDQWDGDEAYMLDNGTWRRILTEVPYFVDLDASSGFLAATAREEVFIYDKSLSVVRRFREYKTGNPAITPIEPRGSLVAADGSVWVADYLNGLIRVNGGQDEQFLPSGPVSNNIFSLTYFRNQLWISEGGRTDPWNNQFRTPLFQRFQEGEWRYYSPKEYPEMKGFFDIVQVVVDPRDPGHFFAASWGGGVLEFKDEEFITRYNNMNSPLQTAIPEQPQEPYTRIGGMAFDSESKLWITNSQSSYGLHSLNHAREWKSYELTEVSGFEFTIGQLIITRNDDKWVVVPRDKASAMYVVNKNGSAKRSLSVTSYFNNGELVIYNRMNDVYSIAEDLNGEIWVGTSKGIAVFANPERVWKDEEYYAYQPSLELNDGIYHPLLETETVTSIVVDGANRKWLGTRNSGVYLVSSRGDTEILHFTSENSPLLSNTITSMAMNEKTGELYIGTDKGLISYQGDAPPGKEDYSEAYVYPNPVRETYTGNITITGLLQNTDVRITDIAGNLVFKGKSLGSNVVWDGKNLNGNRVSTGVYLIFCADASGDKTCILKLLFIR
ncbi:MAG: T9SS type A sorting domain-containing protein [Prolixibacteraceae bacterium]|jgi:streptogramin lyase|nr:T9SS type A sorting domain-containing protein [Prolixibacteraceae bacterium]MDI9562938.1 T9SS type A sorting domain-containing protein [Bacteroidota bacterium]NLS99873.1 T9SS type A sorting domain-containing protein [Bacteroidales bacterium]OQB80172.1 MAG: Two component regulator propeller [Bacteroidetes bacterium ADurb.Bin123]HNZ67938.1 T9SS type A sorting domain-containing protein [Prolixibacteraceae bacterium]